MTICKALDLVTTETDPTDRRAKIVTFTKHGRKLINEQLAVITAIDDAVREKFGDKEFERLRQQLAALSDLSDPSRST